jgi:hypothetical protein
MHRLLFALALVSAALVASLADVSSAQARRHHHIGFWTYYRKHVDAPAPPFPLYYVPANRPRWLPWRQCYTEGGHGRYLPCGVN